MREIRIKKNVLEIKEKHGILLGYFQRPSNSKRKYCPWLSLNILTVFQYLLTVKKICFSNWVIDSVFDRKIDGHLYKCFPKYLMYNDKK